MDINSMYNEWLEATNTPELAYLHDELESVKDNPEDINDRFYRELEFGTAGLRGVIGAGTNRMNVLTVGKVTWGIAKYLNQLNTSRKSSVVIAYDSRHMSKEFALASALILNACGVITYSFETLHPTPMLSFAVRYLRADAGIMITASHNPSKYNGYKLYGSDGAQIMPEPCKLITAEVDKITSFFDIPTMDYDYARMMGMYRDVAGRLIKDYYNLVETTIINKNVIAENKDKIKIVYSPLFGCGNVPVCTMLSRLGFDFEVVKEQQMPNGDFPGLKNPNPEFKEAFDIAKTYADKNGATLLIATDPDADRVGVVSKYNGEYYHLTGNQMGALLLNYALTARKENGTLKENAAFVKSIVSSVMVDKIADSFGVETVQVLTGFKFIADKIALFEKIGKQFILGFEESYGYLAGSFVRDKDAVIATVLICEMAAYYASRGMTVYEGLLELYEKYGFSIEQVVSYEFEGQAGMMTMSAIMEHLRSFGYEKLAGANVISFADYKEGYVLDKTTGEKKDTDIPSSNVLSFEMDNDTKVIIRPSGTEPKIKLYFFSANQQRELANDNIEALKAEMDKIVKSVK